MRSLCIYCGSAVGSDPAHRQGALDLASAMIQQQITLVYGGGNIGLMGVIADEVMRLGGEAIGIIPQALLEKEIAHRQLTKLHVVKDMHERKAMMANLSDGFVAMPGGIGTLEELFEAFTWLQLGLHAKPVGIFNVAGYYDGLLKFIGHMVQQGFLRPRQADMLIQANDVPTLLEQLRNFSPPAGVQVLDPSKAGKLLP